MDKKEFVEMCQSNGRLGGLKKAANERSYYAKMEKKAINLYINDLTLNQKEIAEICGISQSHVSRCTEGLSKIRKMNKSNRKTINQQQIISIIDVLHKKHQIDLMFLNQVFEDKQDEIESDFKL